MTTLSHGRVLRIAGPIVLSNATVPLLGAVDTAVIGQLGQAAPLGAVGIGAVILATLYWAFGFLRMSTSGLAAQAQGAGDMTERSAVLIRALIIGGIAGLALVVAQVVLFTGAFALAPASAEVEGPARQYLAIRIWGAPATIGLYALTGWLIGLERTKGVLVLQLWQNGLNIGLDLWFVIGLGWGVPGVAAATLIAEWTGLMLGLWLARDAFGPVLRAALARLPDPVALRLMFTASRDIMARTVILQLSFTSFVFLGARFGDVTLAANQVLMQFLEITAYALDGFAFAAEALIGQAVGARSAAESRHAGLLCMQWGFGGAAVLAGVFLLAGPQVIDLMTTAPDVREAARQYLPWLIAAPLIGVAAWIYDGIFIGAMLTGDMLRAMLVSVAVYVLALAMMIPAFGNHGLWAALMVLNATRTVTMWRRYPKVAARAGG
ncbi:MAG: MATE family efflux transporter [Tabrizicola sp.]|uniref:MATE family efflux transporter n=1 Tax=Tabrizicola sp. TaxID=2005166 RepID=UPI0027361949|nr:MATE family efflux transporter [Tabrizicola sp.]MDP3264815.1 MATE family efflux transporter [Tabrizicola sp.]MDP3647550.1 MATE family efflux transporter [Paracoccaceae bacterium]MDZ4069115.1 MATE family efflux transporter [Tabrizicola sp.]